MDHDQRFKTLIRLFFTNFLHLFFEEWAARLDLDNIEWLDKELYPDPPEGSLHGLDLVARVPVNDDTQAMTILLVNIEIESPDRRTRLKPRFSYYYHFLRDKYQLPVLPIAVYLKVGLNGIGADYFVESVWDFEVNRFQYLYVGLPGLDALEYVEGENWLGVALAALMRIPPERVVWLGAEALRRLAGAPLSEHERFLLAECVQAYLPLDETQQQELEKVLQTEPYVEVNAMNQTVYEKGLEKGLEKGRHQERLDLVLLLLEKRFAKLTQATRRHVEELSMEELWQLTPKISSASSLSELGLPE